MDVLSFLTIHGTNSISFVAGKIGETSMELYIIIFPFSYSREQEKHRTERG